MTIRHFCTYFDHRYLAEGLALHASLQRHSPGCTIWVLCLSEQCEILLRAANLPGMRLLSLADLENSDPELAATRGTRSLIEYYFTCSPCLPRHLLREHGDIDAITYLDADLYFFSSPEPIFEELGDAEVGITPHRFPARKEPGLLRYGRYNVGWLTFRRGEHALACLDWWRARCIEWCFDRVESGRFADQKYLDQFDDLFNNVHAIEHAGVNLAPWNVAGSRVSQSDGDVLVDGAPLVFFHFQGLKQLRPGVYDTNLDDYDARLTPALRKLVYEPYLKALRAAADTAEAWGVIPARAPHLRTRRASLQQPTIMIDRAITSMRAILLGSIIRS